VARKALNEVRLVQHPARAKRRALNVEALIQERVEIDRLELAQEAEQDRAPLRRERGTILVPVRRTDEVDHDARTVPAVA
jgi:hypothetical protein